MALSIQERLKDLRLDRGLTLEQLSEQIGLSKSALGSYESDDFKDISHAASCCRACSHRHCAVMVTACVFGICKHSSLNDAP